MAEKDRISELPAHILDSILGFLPIEEAARTAVLSTIWKDIWFSLTKLNFNYDFFHYINDKYDIAHGYKGFDGFFACFDVIDQILMRHNGPIRKFVCNYFEDIPLFESLKSDFNQWLLSLTRNGVEEIDLCVLFYTVPSCIFSCPTLKILDLRRVSCKLINGRYVLPNVTSLSFELVAFHGGNRLGCVFYLPILENLSFEDCYVVFPFNIVAPKLGSLTITHYDYHAGLDFLPPKLDLRYISTLELDYYFMKGFVKELTKAGQQPLALNVEHLKVTIGGRSSIDLLQMCPKLCKLDTFISLEFDSEASEILEELRSLTQTQKTLHTLKLSPFYGSRAEMQVIEVLLACFSRLEKVVIIPRANLDFNKKYKSMQELLCFPRSSPNAKIIYI